MKLIKLTNYGSAMVDDDRYEELNHYSWYRQKLWGKYVALRNGGPGEPAIVSMHRQVAGVTDSKILVGHIDSNGLNNQRANLQVGRPTRSKGGQ